MKATIDAEACTFTLSGGSWIGTYLISDYSRRVTFYQAQQERYPVHAKTYQPTVDALAGPSVHIRALKR
ncbi:hypothetical protein CYK37_10840 [Mesorhizobium loti]|nr:hypothetical protein CYK37_10840 [Mesorhizobium loti]